MRVTLDDGRELSIKFSHEVDGGLTWCFIAYEPEGTKYTEYARCNQKDQFDKATGRRVALQRNIDLMRPMENLTKDDVTQIWNAYFDVHNDLDKLSAKASPGTFIKNLKREFHELGEEYITLTEKYCHLCDEYVNLAKDYAKALFEEQVKLKEAEVPSDRAY
jgi:hypothetical protein